MSSWFLSAAATVAAVLGIRLLVKERVNCRLRYGLWLLVLLRLLIPVNFAGSAMSLERLMPPGPAVAGLATETVIQYGTGAEAAVRTASNGNGWLLLWLAGTGTVLVSLLISGVRMNCRLRRDRVRLEGTCCPVPVYVTGVVDAPCLVGLFRPAVYVTEQAAGEAHLDHVLRHEMTHLLHFDHLWSVLRCVALALHWFDPLVWLAVRYSKEDAELACDEGVLESMGLADKLAYGSTLIALSGRVKKGEWMMGMNSMLSGKKCLKKRIEAVACGKRTRRTAAMLAAVLCILTAGCTFTDAPETTRSTQPRETVSTENTIPDLSEQLEKEEATTTW